jgi:hypothetical protein
MLATSVIRTFRLFPEPQRQKITMLPPTVHAADGTHPSIPTMEALLPGGGATVTRQPRAPDAHPKRSASTIHRRPSTACDLATRWNGRTDAAGCECGSAYSRPPRRSHLIRVLTVVRPSQFRAKRRATPLRRPRLVSLPHPLLHRPASPGVLPTPCQRLGHVFRASNRRFAQLPPSPPVRGGLRGGKRGGLGHATTRSAQ